MAAKHKQTLPDRSIMELAVITVLLCYAWSCCYGSSRIPMQPHQDLNRESHRQVDVCQRISQRDEVANLAQRLEAADRVVVELLPSLRDRDVIGRLRFSWYELGRPASVELDLHALEPFSGRGYIGRVQAIAAPLLPFVTEREIQKVVYSVQERREVSAFFKKFIGEPKGVIALEEVVAFLRPDLPSTALPMACFAITGAPPKEVAPTLFLISKSLDAAAATATAPPVPYQGACAALLEREARRRAIARESGAVNRYWVLRRTATLLREAIADRLQQEGEKGAETLRHDGSSGSATLTVRATPVLNCAAIRMRYPELTQRIERSITKERLMAAFRERGMTSRQAESVVDTLYQETGVGSPRADISPAYQSLYRDLRGEPVVPDWKVHPLVTTRKGLERVVRALTLVESFSIDTETWGPPGEPPDRDLCLIQIGIRPSGGNKGQVYLIQVKKLEQELRVMGRSDNPLEPLRVILESESVKKVAHHKQFEEAQFRKYGIELASTDDTKTLVKALRPDLPSYTLRACCYEVMGVVLSKEQQLSDWNKEKLSKEQIGYAALDAEYTLKLYDFVQSLAIETIPDQSGSLDDLLWRLLVTECNAVRIGNAVGLTNEYWALGVSIETIEADVGRRLKEELSQDPALPKIEYVDAYGSVSCLRPRERVLVEPQLFLEHPAVAEAASEYRIREEVVRGFLFERGLTPEEIDAEIERLTVDTKVTRKLKVAPRYELWWQQPR